MWKSLVVIAICTVLVQSRIVKRQTKKDCPDECKNVPLDISFIVDASASIWPKNFTIGLWFVQSFISDFNIGPGKDQVRVSMVTYGDRVYEEDAFGFNTHTDLESLSKAIEDTPYPSGTSTETGKALEWYLDNHQPESREGVRSMVIVLTDGNSQEGEKTRKAAEKALKKGLEVFAIGVGHEVSQRELHNIASDDSHVFVVNQYDALENIKHRLQYETCGVKPDPECHFSPVDIAFVIDSSRSIGHDDFAIEQEFIKEFISAFKINPSSARVAAVMFGDRVYSESAIMFDAHKDKKSTIDAILALPYMNGASTLTGGGIEFMIDNFKPAFRSHAAHIGIIITDGQSQNYTYTRRAAEEARAVGITTVAVGVGQIGATLDGRKELNHIAGDPSRVITADNFAELASIRQKLVQITCTGIAEQMRETRVSFMAPDTFLKAIP